MNYLQGKTAIITGASSGIGAASAKALAAAGVKVVAASLTQDRLDDLVDEIRQAGGEATGRVTDMTNLQDARALGDFAVETYGTIDILINNAGLMLFSYWSDLAVDDWEKMVDTNVKGYLHGVAAVLPTMLDRGKGQILNMDSVAGHQVDAAAGVYSSTKFFVQAMTESMRKDLGVNHGIRVNTLSPGVVNTGWAERVTDPKGREAAKELNKIAIESDDVAQAVLFSLNQPENVTVNDLIISPTRQNW